ncbi:MAG TPA: LytR C-terminal domain-containing protein [Pseudoduganella sp.]
MIKLKPIALAAIGCGLLTACSAPPAPRPLSLQPVVRGDMPGNQAASWNRLARFHHERGQLALALGAYAQSLALDANQLEARNAVAVIEAQRGDLTLAHTALAALVKDYPGEAQPHTNLGYVQFLMGDHAGAALTLRRAMALGAGPKAFQNLQLAEAAMGKSPAAAAPQLAAAPVAPEPAAPLLPAAAVPAPAAAAPSVVATSAGAATAVAAASESAPNMALLSETAAPGAARAPRKEPQPLAALPSAREGVSASHLELIKVAGNASEPKARVAGEPAAAPVESAAPIIAAAEPKPAAQAVTPVAPASQQRMARLEVSNGNGVTGMARRFRSVLGQMGIPVDRLSNAKPYRQAVTVIQYSPGFEKQAASLQKALQGKAQLSSQQLSSSDVRLLLGKDARDSLTAATEAAALSMVAMAQKD